MTDVTQDYMDNYSYSLNQATNELTIFEGNRVLATVSDVTNDNKQEMFEEVLYELRGYDEYS